MKSVALWISILAITVGAGSMAQAQATRTWVSGVGDDANPCSRTAPCKTFAGAISKTAAGGEIDALDPGGFGGVTVTKAITIDGGGGVVASLLVSGTNGVSINGSAWRCCHLEKSVDLGKRSGNQRCQVPGRQSASHRALLPSRASPITELMLNLSAAALCLSRTPPARTTWGAA